MYFWKIFFELGESIPCFGVGGGGPFLVWSGVYASVWGLYMFLLISVTIGQLVQV